MNHLTERMNSEIDYVNSLNFEVFNPVKDLIEQGIKDATISLIGKRRVGKSNFIRDFVSKVGKYYKEVYVFSGTAKGNKGFWSFIKPENMFDGIDEQALNKIWDDQFQMLEGVKESERSKMPYVLIIFDDVIQSTTGVRYSDFICKLYSNGRHYNICSVLAVQSLKMISKHSRDNTDVTIAYTFKNRKDKIDFSDENLDLDPSVGLKIMNKVTLGTPYQCIVCLNYKNTDKIEESVKTYVANPKAMPEKRERIGAPRSIYKDNYGNK